MTPVAWWSHAGAADLAALPALAVQQWFRPLAWGVVVAWLLLQALQWWQARRGATVSGQTVLGVLALVVGSMVLPGGASAAYWLGLAFQQPSLASVVLCGGSMLQMLRKRASSEPNHAWQMTVAVVAVVLGWVLLLDSFALFGPSIYAWGFSPAAVLALAMAACLPWLVASTSQAPLLRWGLPLLVLTFVATRLPTGNVWDAVLDPWLWGAAHLACLHAIFRGRRRR